MQMAGHMLDPLTGELMEFEGEESSTVTLFSEVTQETEDTLVTDYAEAVYNPTAESTKIFLFTSTGVLFVNTTYLSLNLLFKLERKNSA